MELDLKEMARKLIKLRGSRSQATVADALGISVSALSMYENGERVPRDVVKQRIASYYKRSVPFIFFNLKEHDSCDDENEDSNR